MSGSGANKRSQALAVRCYNLRQEGLTLTEISGLVGLDRDKVYTRIILGERLSNADQNTQS
jgi:hypothetical protein